MEFIQKYFFETYYEYTSIELCRAILFIQYVSIQSSGWLIVLFSLDRLVALIAKSGSVYKSLPFGTINSAWLWSLTAIATVAGLNYQILVFPDSFRNETTSNASILADIQEDIYCSQFSNGNKFIQNWDDYLVYVYFYLPIVCIFVVNLLLIIKYFCSRKANSNNTHSKSVKRRLSLTLNVVAVSSVYIIMTLPYALYWGILYVKKMDTTRNNLGIAFDLLAFSCNSTVFFVSVLTNIKFRQEACKIFKKFRC